MFEIRKGEDGRVKLAGRLDAAEADGALAALSAISAPLVADCAELEYISSAGLSVILQTYKRLLGLGHPLRLVNLQPRVRNVFTYAGLDRFLTIE